MFPASPAHALDLRPGLTASPQAQTERPSAKSSLERWDAKKQGPYIPMPEGRDFTAQSGKRHSPRAFQGARVTLARFSDVAPALDAAAFRGPVHKPLHVFAVFPGKVKKLSRSHVCRFFSEKRLKPPMQVRTFPRFPSIAPGSMPVVPKRFKHFFLRYCNSHFFYKQSSSV